MDVVELKSLFDSFSRENETGTQVTFLRKRELAARELNVYRSYPRLNFLGEWKQSLLLIESIGLGTPSLGKFTLSAAVPGKEVEFLLEGVV